MGSVIGNSWYTSIKQPSFTPPNWIFAPAWTVLYILIGISGGLLFHHRKTSRQHTLALRWYFIQLLFNFSWSYLFFAFQQIHWAFVDITALWISITFTITYCYRAKSLATYLLAPYWIWICFAAVLNGAIWYLN